MGPTGFSGRRWPVVVVLALAALAIGALFGSFRNGSAAITAKPTNTTPPAISGTAQVGNTLTANNGTWGGTSPFQFSYQWSRCDKDGKNCNPISGANDNSYAVQNADIGTTLIITVTASNSEGKDSQPSNPTGLVAGAAPPTGCPSGTGTIAIADLTVSTSTRAPRSRGSSRRARTRSSSRSRSPRAAAALCRVRSSTRRPCPTTSSRSHPSRRRTRTGWRPW